MKTIQELKNEFNAITLIRVFEIKVMDTRTNEEDYILFDISIDGDELRAEHIGLTKKEEENEKIAFKSLPLDDCFTLDEHLQELQSECIEAICNSDFYIRID